MKKIITVVGARPQFIKAAVISRVFLQEYSGKVNEIIVHTGQHYDHNMSEVFFNEMEIPEPDFNLNIGSGSHGKMTGRMLEGIEKLLLDEKPDLVLVYGDTNSTIAGALAASKLQIPVAHVEAGLRSFNMGMPEEQNRILTDHISSFLFCPTDTAVANLKSEGLICGVIRTGDVMLDASLFYRKKERHKITDIPGNFVLMTLHRAENTDDPQRLGSIISAVNEMPDLNFVIPLHPRTRKKLEEYDYKFASHINVMEPVGFFDMLYLEEHCQFVMTDSGGMQKEAFFFKKPCITLRDQTEWVETVDTGWNTIVGADKDRILKAVKELSIPYEWPALYGDGKSGKMIASELIKNIC